MEGREGMSFPGSSPYYINRDFDGTNNIHGSSLGSPQTGELHASAFKSRSNPNIQLQQPNVMVTSSGGASGSPFHVENPSSNFSQGGMGMAMVPSPGLGSGSGSGGGEIVKKKRGRPRKYGPDGGNSGLGLSPVSASRPFSSGGEMNATGEKPRKGRPPGSGWKQRLANVGEWMNSSAGLAFTPHVLHVGTGEDVAAKILAFAQQRARALCVLSATGTVSAVTLRQPTNSGGTVSYEGRFEILCLSGSYLLADSGGPSNRTGGISISFCSPDGQILGGALGGRLIASNPVQVIACSFVYGEPKVKSKSESESKDETHLVQQSAETKAIPPVSTSPPSKSPVPKNSEIDLAHG